MDLNQKIAERRAELQREQAAEEERKKQEERERVQLRQQEEKVIQELAAKEANEKVQAIEARLQAAREGETPIGGNVIIPVKREDGYFDEKQKRVTEEAERKVSEHIRKLAQDRMTSSENWSFGILVFGGILGFFYAWWLGLGFWIGAGFYLNNVIGRYEAEIKSKLGEDYRA